MHRVTSNRALLQLIGERVRQGRIIQGWTLDQLSEKSGVSRRTIVNVEKGSLNPGIVTLLRLSDALGIGLPSLVGAHLSQSTKVVRAGHGAVLWESTFGGHGVLVGGIEPPDVVELWDWTLGPGDHYQSEAHVPGTHELLQVLDGEIVVRVADEAYCLRTGDALTFSSDVDHSYSNTTEGPARFSLAVFEPGVGKAHRTEIDNDANTDS